MQAKETEGQRPSTIGTLKSYARGGLVDLQNAVVHAFPDAARQAEVQGQLGQITPQEAYSEKFEDGKNGGVWGKQDTMPGEWGVAAYGGAHAPTADPAVASGEGQAQPEQQAAEEPRENPMNAPKRDSGADAGQDQQDERDQDDEAGLG